MDALENIELFQNLIYVSYAVAAIGLGFAVFFFFYFKIPEVFILMTGKGKQDTIKKISEENFKTGNIRFNGTTGSTKRSVNAKGHTGSIAAIHISSESQELTAPIEETAVLETPIEETSVLERPIEETSVLHKEETVAPAVPPVVSDNSQFQVVEQTILIHTDELIN